MSGRCLAITFVTCAVFVAGCNVSLTVPNGARVSCNKTADCPSGYLCSANHCVMPTGKGCHENSDCYDDNYCNGIETCAQGHCVTGNPPCQNTPDCMLSTCTLTGPGTVTCGTPQPSDATCGPGMYCNLVSGCLSCSTPEHCGGSCLACSGAAPICGGVDIGCVCDPSPAPNGSCGAGSMCSNNVCVTCDTTNVCGPSCEICSGNTPVCSGIVAGCVVDSTIDPSSGGCVNQPDFTRCQITVSPYRYAVCANGNCVSPGCGACSAGTCDPSAPPDGTCNTPGPGYAQAGVPAGWENPDTDQRTCSDPADGKITCPASPCTPCTGSACLIVSDQSAVPDCGQDAQYGWDTTNPESARYTVVTGIGEEPVVADNVTGLMWQRCAAGLSGDDCAGGLGASMGTWTSALQYCNGLTWGGYSDWRLPDIFELLSIVDYGTYSPAIDSSAFPATPASESVTSLPAPVTYFWASTTWSYNGSYCAWSVESYFGGTFCAGISGATIEVYYARCVRGGPLSQNVVQRFSRTVPANNQPLVTDNRTGLVWQGCAAGATATTCCSGSGDAACMHPWQDALAYCEGLNWGGYSDWRLPSVKETANILSPYNVEPMIDATNFPDTPPELFWTSTSYIAGGAVAWSVDFRDGGVTSRGMINSAYVRCVRGGP